MSRLLYRLRVSAPTRTLRRRHADPQIRSPHVEPDHRVIFSFRAPHAIDVSLEIDGTPRIPMRKDEQGVWTVTTGPLDPDFYSYHFVADGTGLHDPANPLIKPNLLHPRNILHVPGPSSLPWEINDVPHGTVHRHFYKSEVLGDTQELYVYTPPGYDRAPNSLWPVLYLLHGFSDDASAWIAVGRANVILDNLIAQAKAEPMLVVMPFSYGAPEILVEGSRSEHALARNTEKFLDVLLTEVLPTVETRYRVRNERDARAIAGFSMGGAESLYTGLNALDRFAWIGAFSASGFSKDFGSQFPALAAAGNAAARLLWIACGTDDMLIDINRQFSRWLRSNRIRHTALETPGAHAWMVWRRNLITFLSLLFREQ